MKFLNHFFLFPGLHRFYDNKIKNHNDKKNILSE